MGSAISSRETRRMEKVGRHRSESWVSMHAVFVLCCDLPAHIAMRILTFDHIQDFWPYFFGMQAVPMYPLWGEWMTSFFEGILRLRNLGFRVQNNDDCIFRGIQPQPQEEAHKKTWRGRGASEQMERMERKEENKEQRAGWSPKKEDG